MIVSDGAEWLKVLLAMVLLELFQRAAERGHSRAAANLANLNLSQ